MLERRPNLIALLCMIGLLGAFAAIWLPLLPNAQDRVSVDFSLWLPDLLAGYFWYLHNGFLQLPWFSPAQCGGIPFHADPQVAFLSVPQFLTFIMPPLPAVRVTVLVFAAAGFWGAWQLARRSFALGVPAALLVAGLFMLNGFFAVRMVVGHLTYAPFMLLPALAALALPAPGAASPRAATEVLRAGMIGLIFALAVQAGMVHALPPLCLSLLAILLIHALRFTWRWAPLCRLAAGGALGLALCAGKLAAGLALLAQFPRTLYPLPGIPGIATLLGTVLRCLFLPVDDQMGHLIANVTIWQEQHEFEYGVSPAPALLMLGWVAWRITKGKQFFFEKKNQKTFVCLLGVLALPIVLNFYQPAWNGFLKSLPFFGSSSTNLRWLSALILPAILGGALALQDTPPLRRHQTLLAACGLAIAIGTAALGDHTKYGPRGMGFYNPAELDAAWHAAHASGTGPSIAAIGALLDADSHPVMLPERQNAFTHGFSELFCYEPLFGYRLESFPMGGLRGGDVMDARGGRLNIKNPACYVFPAANACKPGDEFADTDAERAAAFIDYRPFAFERPLYARLANWLSLLSALAVPPVFLAAWWKRRVTHAA
jgi:hypothetical protein